MNDRRRRSFDDLPLFLKLLVPFALLLVVVGSFGAFLLVRNDASRAQTTLDRELQEVSLRLRSALQAQELSLLESANLASNLQGVPEAVRDGDAAEAERLLLSVVALKSDLDWVALLLADGTTWVTLDRSGRTSAPRIGVGASVVQRVLDAVGTTKQPDLIQRGEGAELVIAAPVCLDAAACQPIGVAVAGRDLGSVTAEALAPPSASTPDLAAAAPQIGARLVSPSGDVLTAVGPVPDAPPAVVDAAGQLTRVSEQVAGDEGQTLYAPLTLQGAPAGTVAVSLPTAAVLDEVRRTGTSLAVVVLVFLLGIVAIGAIVSRRILRQVSPLLATKEALGAGDLSARVPVVSNDEIGQVAEGLNTMAARLEATYNTLEMRVEERTDRVRELLSQRTQFFASLSHELRTPLAIVLSQADMLLLGDDDTVQLARPIKQSAAQLLDTVNEILDVAKAEAGTLEVEPAATDVGAFIGQLLPTIEGLASSGGLRLRVTLPPSLPPVLADVRRLRQILLNLVDNAVKYTQEGGSVTIAAKASADRVVMSVADDGVGIPDDVGDAIFEPFRQVAGTSPRRGRGSSGLGLALVRRLVDAHGGTISYSSRVGRGTTFEVVLPIAVPAGVPSGAASAG